jgi:alpha/beta superfamily hydrolase
MERVLLSKSFTAHQPVMIFRSSTMSRGIAKTQAIRIEGDAGPLSVLIDSPPTPRRGIALVAHHRGTQDEGPDSPIVRAMAAPLLDAGFVTLRPALRGAPGSAGRRTHGEGEAHDLTRIVVHALRQYGELPVILGGFSFGAYVAALAAKRLHHAAINVARLILVGLPVGDTLHGRAHELGACAAPALIVHADDDDRVPLCQVLDWARPHAQPITVVPGAGHFFEAHLDVLQLLIVREVAQVVTRHRHA